MALIEFHHISKAFGPKVVFRDLTLEVHQGELLTIIGGSGTGKSVTLKLLIGLLRPDAGSILYKGEETTTKTERELTTVRRDIGMLFQAAALFDSMSVRDNIAYGLHEHYHMSGSDIDERVAESLSNVGLPGIEQMWPADLSGGMKKRVGLARAIAMRPEVLLYDEPTTGLDPINTTRINRLILHLKQRYDMTSVVVTHDMNSAFTVSDRMAMIHQGAVIFSGTPDEVRATDVKHVRNFIEGNAPQEEESVDMLLRAGG